MYFLSTLFAFLHHIFKFLCYKLNTILLTDSSLFPYSRTENNLVIGARISSVRFHTLYLSTSSLDPKKERSCQIPCKDRGEDKPLTMLMGIAIWSCSINTNGITRSFPCSFIDLFRNTRRSYTHDHVTFKK